MARSPVTVAALVGADRQATRGFLALLAGTLSARDDVVLVGPGHDPSSPSSWRVVANRKLARSPGAGPLHSLVVVVDERAVPAGPWLEPLVAALDDPGVGAVAARTNIAAGDELLVGVPYRPHEAAAHRALVRHLANGRAADRTPVEGLSGPSLAVRRSTLDAAGGLIALLGPDPVAELARQASAGGGALVVAEGSYLHHGGGPAPRSREPGDGPRPFVSACLITKDEHCDLPRCLASIGGLADEIVVYDTGSTDDTPDIARAHGATVVEGYWDGDFARARNEALAHCRGQWVLWIDADEALVCDDPAASRRVLAELSSDVEALIVLIDNLRANRASTTLTHPACRLFRRAYGHWSGRLHEQVTARAGTPALAMLLAHGARITHWGYLDATIGDRGKGARNVRSALGDLTGDSDLSWATRLLSLGRSYGLAGRPEEALPLCRAAAEAAERPATRRLALRSIIENLLALDRGEEALSETARLRQMTAVPLLADGFEGRALLKLGRYEEALAALDRVTAGLDDDGYEHSPHGVAAEKASALMQLERYGEAADVLLAGLRSEGGMDVHVGFLVECLEQADRPLSELADAVPPERAVAFLGQLVHLDPDLADRVLDAWYAARPSRAVLATATAIAAGLSVDRLRAWSERLRREGLGHACPLVATVADTARPLADRALGAAVAFEAFGDERGRFAFGALTLQLAATARGEVRRRVATAAPSLLPVLDAAADLGTAAVRPARAEGAAEPASEGGRSVLVVDRRRADLRTLAVAAAVRRAGHEVTVLHPQPAAQTEELLAPLGVAVGGWHAGEAADSGWTRPLAATLARRYAERTFDTVVLGHAALGAAPEVRRLLPAAHVVVDTDYDPEPPADCAGMPDLVLSSLPARSRTGTVPAEVLAESAPDLFGAVAPVPGRLRTGICVVGAFGAAGDDELAIFEQVAADLGQRAPSAPVAVVGDDPRGRIAAALPRALHLGPIADPLPWLRTARVVLVAVGSGAGHWLAAATMCGTPALVVPSAPEARDQVAPAVAALADPRLSELWDRFAPDAGAGPGIAGAPAPAPAPRRPSDPLAPLPPPFRRSAATAPRGGLAVRWRGEPPASPARHLGGAGGHPTGDGAGEEDRPAIEVRRGWPRDLSPAADRLVIELCWPFGGLPAEWLGPLRDLVDEVWAPTGWHRDQAMASGVPGELVQVVPYGVDPEPFFPDGARRRPGDTTRSRLLFVGEPDERDGLDALLETYLTTFSTADDVSLVVRLQGAPDGDRRDRRLEELVRRAAEHPGAGRPEVQLVTGAMAVDERADLYRSCDVLVQPHRATDDPTPMLEAMAAGLPVVVLDGGPCRELCDERTGWLVGCRRVAVDREELGLTPSRAGFWQLEPDRAGLAQALRQAVGDPERRLRKGLAARDRVAGRFTLDHVAAVARARLEALGGEGDEVPTRVPTQDRVPAGR